MRLFLCLLLTLLPISAKADTAQAKDCQSLGWHFYCDPIEKEYTEDPKTDSIPQYKNGQEYIKAYQEKLEFLKAQAVWQPTEENIKAYLDHQKEALHKSSQFTKNWKQVVWQDPNYDYLYQSPVQAQARQIWHDQNKSDQLKSLESLSSRYGMFFIYDTNCKYCALYSKILKNFKEQTKISITAVSKSDQYYPEWPKTLKDNGQLAHLGLSDKPVPATLLFDKETKSVIPIGFGVMSPDELLRRIHILTNREANNVY